MATRTTSSSTTTTRTLIQEPLGGKSVVRYDNVTTSEERKKTLKERQLGQGALSSLFRVELIAITILSISVGSALAEFSTEDLIETTPNYQVVNDFVPIDDPLNTINYITYGEDVFDRVVSFVQGFSDAGLLVKSYWDAVVSVFEPEVVDTAVTFLIDFNRLFKTLEVATDIYDSMTSSEKIAYGIFYPDINWLVKWMYYSPAELTA